MPTIPRADWTETLDRINEDLSRSLAQLDHFEAESASSLRSAEPSVSPEQLFVWLERRLGAWDSKLDEAVQLATSVEAQFDEREAALTRWRETFVRWHELIEKGEARIGPSKGLPVAE